MPYGEDVQQPAATSPTCTEHEEDREWNPHPRRVPTKSEIQSTQALIEQDDETIHDLELQIKLVEATVLKLRNQLSLIEQARQNKIAFIAPCRRIPFEILAEIFAFSVENRFQSLQVIASVCRQWRHVAINSSRLWNRLRVSLMDHTQRFKGGKRFTGEWQKANTGERLRDCLKRAGQTDDLHIHLAILNAPREIQQDDKDMMETLRKSLPRWRTVTLEINRKTNLLEDFDNWTSLRWLSINFLRYVEPISFSGLFTSIEASADKLETLCLYNDSAKAFKSLPVISPRLKEFSMQECGLRTLYAANWEQLNSLLLTNCTGVLSGDTVVEPTTTCFPVLTLLRLEKTQATILTSFQLPRLRTLTIADCDSTFTSKLTLQELRELDLQLYPSQSSILNYLVTPNLEIFEYKQSEPSDLTPTSRNAILADFFKSIARNDAFNLRFISLNDVILEPDTFEHILKGSPNLAIIRLFPAPLSTAQKLLCLGEDTEKGTLIAPMLREIKLRVLTTIGIEKMESSLAEGLAEIATKRTATHPFSLRIFRNILK